MFSVNQRLNELKAPGSNDLSILGAKAKQHEDRVFFFCECDSRDESPELAPVKRTTSKISQII